jgi:hypothetical protein
MTTDNNGTTTLTFTVTTACSCKDVYHGIVNAGVYRSLPTEAYST